MKKAAGRINNVEGRMETFPNLSGPFQTFPHLTKPFAHLYLAGPFRSCPQDFRRVFDDQIRLDEVR